MRHLRWCYSIILYLLWFQNVYFCSWITVFHKLEIVTTDIVLLSKVIYAIFQKRLPYFMFLKPYLDLRGIFYGLLLTPYNNIYIFWHWGGCQIKWASWLGGWGGSKCGSKLGGLEMFLLSLNLRVRCETMFWIVLFIPLRDTI